MKDNTQLYYWPGRLTRYRQVAKQQLKQMQIPLMWLAPIAFQPNGGPGRSVYLPSLLSIQQVLGQHVIDSDRPTLVCAAMLWLTYALLTKSLQVSLSNVRPRTGHMSQYGKRGNFDIVNSFSRCVLAADEKMQYSICDLMSAINFTSSLGKYE